jgi:hypothetical protein
LWSRHADHLRNEVGTFVPVGATRHLCRATGPALRTRCFSDRHT